MKWLLLGVAWVVWAVLAYLIVSNQSPHWMPLISQALVIPLGITTGIQLCRRYGGYR